MNSRPEKAWLAAGPVLILLAWFAAGQWEAASAEARSWLLFAGVLCFASVLPLPGRPVSLPDVRTRINWWGWMAVVGLLVTS